MFLPLRLLAGATLLAPAVQPPEVVTVSRAVLSRVLASATACVSPDASRGLWTSPPQMVQVGQTLLLAKGVTAAIDIDAGVVRVFDPSGREVSKNGARGAGPGEFGARATLVRWPGDTVAVSDPETSRITLYASGRFARIVNIAEPGPQLRSTVLGHFADGSMLFSSGNTLLTAGPSPFRAQTLRLVRWHPSAPAELRTVRDSLFGPEMHLIAMPARPTYGVVNFGRRTSIGSVGTSVVVYDNASPMIEMLDSNGRTLRRIVLDVEDPAINAIDRDSVIARLKPPTGPVSPQFLELRTWFPKTRPAALWAGVDAEDGWWLAFHPPVSTTGVAYVRFTDKGVPDRCYRAAPDTRIAAFSRDRILTISEGDDGDVLNAVRTVVFPST